MRPTSRKAMHQAAPRQKALGFTMMGIFAILGLAVLLLGGCGITEKGNFVREAIAKKAEVVAEQTLENNERYMCEFARVGAVKKRYGQNAADADAYNHICEGQEGVDLIGPGE